MPYIQISAPSLTLQTYVAAEQQTDPELTKHPSNYRIYLSVMYLQEYHVHMCLVSLDELYLMLYTL